MSKNKKAKSNINAGVNKKEAKLATASKNKIIIRRVLLGLYFTFGTIIIITAAFLLYVIFGSMNIDNTKFTVFSLNVLYLQLYKFTEKNPFC